MDDRLYGKSPNAVISHSRSIAHKWFELGLTISFYTKHHGNWVFS